jgi:prepilin-type N-terminal cleavage/methylation domain-containing protein
MKRLGDETGFTLVELTVTIVILSIVVTSFFALFVSLVNSTIVAKRQAEALTIATNQVEYLKSLPYDNLAVAGGSIPAQNPLPKTATHVVDGVTYTTTTSIGYVDDAYDGCGSYPNQTLKELYCRNYPPPSGTPTVDTNPADYKIIHVVVTDNTSEQLAALDTQISARVSETASTTGALFVTVIGPGGATVSGATVNVVDNTLSPVVNVSDDTDSNGVAIFYDLTPDSGSDYVISASKAGYSTLTTISASGSLQPTYPNQKILSQQSSFVTLPIYPMGTNSLIVETTDTNGNPLPAAKVAIKGGYKKYTLSTDTSYYYDNTTPTDARPTTDASGLSGIAGLAPINGYLFCGDNGSGGCKVGSTNYYLAAAVPYGGSNSLAPITVPIDDPSDPPTTTFAYGSQNYLQKVRLMLTTSSSFPRVFSMNPYTLSLSGSSLGSFTIAISGYNLSTASASLSKDGTVYTGSSCSKSTTQLTCSFNLTGISVGKAQLTVTNSAGSLILPISPQLGGFDVES